MKKEGCDPIPLKGRDLIPLKEKGGILSRICTAILLSETLFSLPIATHLMPIENQIQAYLGTPLLVSVCGGSVFALGGGVTVFW